MLQKIEEYRGVEIRVHTLPSRRDDSTKTVNRYCCIANGTYVARDNSIEELKSKIDALLDARQEGPGTSNANWEEVAHSDYVPRGIPVDVG
jgi:hypothetical protein